MFSFGVSVSNHSLCLKEELIIPGLSGCESHINTDGILIAVVSRS